MNSDLFSHLLRGARKLPEPENLFSGLRLPANLRVPDSVLVFFHNFTAPAPNSHGRHTLVIPFDEMTYYVDRRRLLLHPGELLFVPPFALRFLHPGSAGYRRLFITFELETPQTYLPRPAPRKIGGAAGRSLKQFLQLYRRSDATAASLELVRFLLCLEPESASPAENPPPERLPAAVGRAMEYIETHLATPFGVPEIAEAVHLSESRLRTRFRAAAGTSLGRYLAEKRLDAAKYALLHSDRRIAEIASGCGFSNVFVFGAFFKRHAGVSPLRFRRGEL